MIFTAKQSDINGEVKIPGSKSHTIRALVFGLLADGVSVLRWPLDSSDTKSCVHMIEQFGARVDFEKDVWKVRGTGKMIPVPGNVIDVGNSGTSLYIGLGVASLIDGYTVFTGDRQIRRRSAESLLNSIKDLGGIAFSTRGNGNAPIVIKGPVKGGNTEIEAVTSQYLTSLLITSPLASSDTIIKVPLLNELPYVTMTLSWLDKLGIMYENINYEEFLVKGNQEYRVFDVHIPADFSSAAFFFVAAAICGAELNLLGLDYNDTQGDKEVIHILRKMGAGIEIGNRNIKISGGELKGGTFDLNAIPDALPALAVAACFAHGETRLINVPQARLKETDRIKVMHDELTKLGADIKELDDGLIIKGKKLTGGLVSGHGDHRVVMSLDVAGIAIEEDVHITTADSAAVTFPDFLELMTNIGSNIELTEE